MTNANYSTGELFAYIYDPSGNRTSQTTLVETTVYTYDNANRLTQLAVSSQPSVVNYSWGNNGNLLNDGQRTFTYDSINRLTSVTGGVTATYLYNGDNDRLAQTVNGVTTNYVLDPVGLAQVLVESAGGPNKSETPGLARYSTTGG